MWLHVECAVAACPCVPGKCGRKRAHDKEGMTIMLLRGKLIGIGGALAVAALFAAPSIAHADIPLVNQAVNMPGTPVTETAQATCSQDSPGTMTVHVWLNGADAADVTIPVPTRLMVGPGL